MKKRFLISVILICFLLILADAVAAQCSICHKDRTTAWRRSGKGLERGYSLSCILSPVIDWFSRLSLVEDQQRRINRLLTSNAIHSAYKQLAQCFCRQQPKLANFIKGNNRLCLLAALNYKLSLTLFWLLFLLSLLIQRLSRFRFIMSTHLTVCLKTMSVQ